MPPKYVTTEPDRHGNERRYYRRNGKRIRLRAPPGSVDFRREIEAAAAAIAALSQKPTKPTSFVYFMLFGSNARVKIGTARDPRRRLQQIATAAPGKVRIYYVTPGGRQLERALHRQFAPDRINREWFNYSKAIRAWIAEDEGRRALTHGGGG